jgi:hypothetical protein
VNCFEIRRTEVGCYKQRATFSRITFTKDSTACLFPQKHDLRCLETWNWFITTEKNGMCPYVYWGSEIRRNCDKTPFFLSSYEGVSKSFQTGRLERELQMVQLSATRCSCITILWVSLVTFATVTLCVASQRVFVVVVFSLSTQSGNFRMQPHILCAPSVYYVGMLTYKWFLAAQPSYWACYTFMYAARTLRPTNSQPIGKCHQLLLLFPLFKHK